MASSFPKPIISFSILLFIALSSTYSNAATFTVRNNCPDTVWAAASPGGGRQMGNGEIWTFDVPAGTKEGRVWARTGCSFDGSGQGHCVTGDCNGRLECQGYGVIPNTLAEFALNRYMNFDFINLSVIDGFNVPMEFSPVDSTGCNTQGLRCTADIIGQCPGQLQTQGGCNNPCSASSGSCPSDLTRFFKDRCPDAYTYPSDPSQKSCPGGTNYRVVFCP